MSEEAERKIAEYFNKAIRNRIDLQLFGFLTGETGASGTGNISSNWPAPELLTLDKLRRMQIDFCQRFPTNTLLQSRWFPSDSAFRVEGPGEIFTCAGEIFWQRLRRELARQVPRVDSSASNPLFGFNYEPTDIDHQPGDDDTDSEGNSRAAYKREIWGRLTEAMRTALVELPEWLRARDRQEKPASEA